MPDEKTKGPVPRLRFPEFRDSGEWEVKRLGDLGKILKGKGISKSDITEGGALACIHYGELYTHYPEVIREIVSSTDVNPDNLVLSEKNDVIIPASGETREDIATASCLTEKGVALGGDLNIFRSALNGAFLAYYIRGNLKAEISRVAQGDAVVHLYPSQLEKVKLAIPPKRNEQQKIADCLGSLDDLIRAEEAALEALKKHKKGLMQQLFPHEGETTPRLRFPEFRDAGEWTKQKLAALEKQGALSLGRGSVISKEDINRNPGSYPIYSSSIKNNGIFGYYGRYMFDEELITWSIDGGGNFFYRPKHKFSVTNVSGYMKLDTSRLDYRFLAYQLMLLHGRLQFDYLAKAHPSVIRELYSVAVPTLQEQKKIGDCLASLDDLIRARSKRIEALKQHKKGLMQQLFPQEVG